MVNQLSVPAHLLHGVQLTMLVLQPSKLIEVGGLRPDKSAENCNGPVKGERQKMENQPT